MCTTDINQIVQSRNCYLCRFTIFVLYLLSGYSDAKWCVSLTSLSIYGWIRWQLNVVNASFVHLTCWNFIAPGCPALHNLLDMVLLGLFSCDLDISTCLSQVTSFYRQCAKKFYHFIAALALDAYVIADTILFFPYCKVISIHATIGISLLVMPTSLTVLPEAHFVHVKGEANWALFLSF